MFFEKQNNFVLLLGEIFSKKLICRLSLTSFVKSKNETNLNWCQNKTIKSYFLSFQFFIVKNRHTNYQVLFESQYYIFNFHKKMFETFHNFSFDILSSILTLNIGLEECSANWKVKVNLIHHPFLRKHFTHNFISAFDLPWWHCSPPLFLFFTNLIIVLFFSQLGGDQVKPCKATWQPKGHTDVQRFNILWVG